MGRSNKLPANIIIYRSLLIVLLVVVGILLGGTVYALFFRADDSPAVSSGSSYQSDTITSPEGEHFFTGIGRLRLATAGQPNTGAPQPVTVVLSVTFPYNPEDRPFSEELAVRVADFRVLTETYFLSLQANDLVNVDEQKIKADLLDRFNSILRLGKINVLYFNDFMILD